MEFLTTARMRKYFVCIGRMVERGLEEGRREVVNLLGGALTLVAGEKSQEKKPELQETLQTDSGSGWV